MNRVGCRRTRDGTVQTVKVEVHPDPLCQELLEQVREAEAVQTVDRVRPIFNRRNLILMNDLCLDATYDLVLTHAKLVAGGTRWERAWRASGILPLGKTDLHKAHPGLFPSESSAKDALKAAVSGGVTQIGLYLSGTPTYFGYRRSRHRHQTGSDSRILVDTERHPNPRAAVELVLGPLVMFRAEQAPGASANIAPVEQAVVPAVQAVIPDASAPLVEDCHLLSEPGALYQRGVVEEPVANLFTVRRPVGQTELVLMELLDNCFVPLPRAPRAARATDATRRHQIWHATRPGAQPQPLRCEVLVV